MIKRIDINKQQQPTLLVVVVLLLLTINSTMPNMTIPNEALGSTVTEREKTIDYCNSLSEPDDYLYCEEFDWDGYGPNGPDRESVEEMCDASEDYAKNPENCSKAYNLLEKSEEVQIEKAAQEDALCDNEDADTTNIQACMSPDRKSNHDYDKESCGDVNGDWGNKKGCTFTEDGQADRELEEEQRDEEDIHKAWAEANNAANEQNEGESFPNVVSSNFESEEIEEESSGESEDESEESENNNEEGEGDNNEGSSEEE